jgi:hypothetical protein
MDIFTRTFNNTLLALEDAAKAVAELKTFDMSDFENNKTVKAFGAAEALIKESFQSLRVSPVLYTMCVHGVIHFPHSSARNGHRSRRTYLLQSRRIRIV